MPTDRRANAAQFLRFLVVGGSGFLLYMVLALLLRAGGLNTGASAWLATVVAIVPVFLLQRRFTFRSRGAVGVQLAGYAALQVTVAFLIAAAARVLGGWGAADWLGFAIAGAVGVLASFSIQRLIVFGRT